MLRGARYITITDRALNVVVERLERERLEFANVLKRYDSEIAGVRELMGSDKKCYWSQACAAPIPGKM
jgi:hypothetical protein